MRAYFIYFFACCASFSTSAQFYPNSNAIWCGWDDDGGPPGFDVQFLLGTGPDTLLQGNLYLKVQEFNNSTGNWVRIRDYYVRSDITGVGYMYLLDSAAEYPTGNISALVGDTVHDVLCIFPPGATYYPYDFVVDSVVSISNSGVTVTRHFVHFDSPFAVAPNVLFWQAGMGTSFGPLIRLHGRPDYCSVDGVVQYNLGINGLPGGPAWCASFSVGLPDTNSSQNDGLRIYLGSSGSTLFVDRSGLNDQSPARVQLFDATGRLVIDTTLKGPKMELDVSSLKGMYTVRLMTGKGRYSGRVVVQ